MEFLPALVLLAVVGILGLERALAGQPVWRRAVRWGWGLLLGFSVAFNLLASVEHCAEAHYNLGTALLGDRAGCRRRSGTTSRRCGSSPIMPRRTTIWESP